jgi:hypothetical protein
MRNKAKLGQDGTSGGWHAREGRLYKTNPIPAGAPWDRTWGRREIVQNEPNFLRRARKTIAKAGGLDTATRQTIAEAVVRNEANSAPARPASGGRLCKTNPVSRLRIGDRSAAGHLPCGQAPPASPGADCAKRSQFRGSNMKREVLYAARVMTNWTHKQAWQNKANSPHQQGCPGARGAADVFGGANCAKQSRFRGTGRRVEYLSFHHSSPMPIVRNKANSRLDGSGPARPPPASGDLSCKTKPISACQADPVDLESAAVWRPHPPMRRGVQKCLRSVEPFGLLVCLTGRRTNYDRTQRTIR